jgi:tetratricopeptide (TPR) repeat protein
MISRRISATVTTRIRYHSFALSGLRKDDTGLEGQRRIVPSTREDYQRLEARGSSRALVHLYYALSDLLWACGRYREALTTGDRSVEVARSMGDDPSLAMALGPQGLAYLMLGRLAEAWRAAEEALTLAEAAGDLYSVLQPLYLLSVVIVCFSPSIS